MPTSPKAGIRPAPARAKIDRLQTGLLDSGYATHITGNCCRSPVMCDTELSQNSRNVRISKSVEDTAQFVSGSFDEFPFAGQRSHERSNQLDNSHKPHSFQRDRGSPLAPKRCSPACGRRICDVCLHRAERCGVCRNRASAGNSRHIRRRFQHLYQFQHVASNPHQRRCLLCHRAHDTTAVDLRRYQDAVSSPGRTGSRRRHGERQWSALHVSWRRRDYPGLSRHRGQSSRHHPTWLLYQRGCDADNGNHERHAQWRRRLHLPARRSPDDRGQFKRSAGQWRVRLQRILGACRSGDARREQYAVAYSHILRKYPRCCGNHDMPLCKPDRPSAGVWRNSDDRRGHDLCSFVQLGSWQRHGQPGAGNLRVDDGPARCVPGYRRLCCVPRPVEIAGPGRPRPGRTPMLPGP